MNIETQCCGYRRTAQNTSSSFATNKIDTITKPSGANVIDLGNGLNLPAAVDNVFLISPLGVGSDNQTFDFRVWGWCPLFDNSKALDKREIWHPTLLGGFSCTLNSSLPGIAGAPVLDTEYYADTIALRTNEGTASVSNEIVSVPGVNAYIALDFRGFWLVEFEFDMTGATSGAVLVKPY